MKRRAAVKGKSMYVIFGLLSILLGSLAYLALQKGSREGLLKGVGISTQPPLMHNVGVSTNRSFMRNVGVSQNRKRQSYNLFRAG